MRARIPDEPNGHPLTMTVPLSSLALFFVGFIAAAGFGQWLALIPGITITLWPPNGVVVATLLKNDRRTWPQWIQ